MATTTTNYGTRTALTITLASLAASSSLIAGQESNEVDNAATDKFVDVLLQARFKTGAASVAAGVIAVYVWGSDVSAATTALDVIDGADSAETITSAGVRDGLLRRAAVITVEAANSRTYLMAPTSLAALFGGVMPKFWGVWVTHSTTAALSSTAADHEISYVGIKYDVT